MGHFSSSPPGGLIRSSAIFPIRSNSTWRLADSSSHDGELGTTVDDELAALIPIPAQPSMQTLAAQSAPLRGPSHLNTGQHFQRRPVSLLGHVQLPRHERECQASSGADLSSIKRDSTQARSQARSGICENFLYGFKAARRAARAADSARTPQLPLTLPLRRRLVPVGWREGHSSGAAEVQAVSRAAADLTREPSLRPTSGSCGQARSQPDPRISVRAAAPCQIRRSVCAKVPHCCHFPLTFKRQRAHDFWRTFSRWTREGRALIRKTAPTLVPVDHVSLCRGGEPIPMSPAAGVRGNRPAAQVGNGD